MSIYQPDTTATAPAADVPSTVCPAVSGDGVACHKKMFTTRDGEVIPHGGGHVFMTEKTARRLANDHYDAALALACLPFTTHTPEECPGPPECYFDILR